MSYDKMYAMLSDVKAMCKAEQRVLDKRTKSYEIVWEQLQDAYRTCCVVENHIRVAERHGKRRKGD